MNTFDLVAATLLVAAAVRGFRQGLAREIYRLVRLTIALIAGSSLVGLIRDLTSRFADGASGWLVPVAFVGVAAGIWLLLRSVRKWAEAWLLAHTPRNLQALGGAVAATLKTVLLLGGVITLFHLATWIPGHGLVAERSLASKIAAPFLPDRTAE